MLNGPRGRPVSSSAKALMICGSKNVGQRQKILLPFHLFCVTWSFPFQHQAVFHIIIIHSMVLYMFVEGVWLHCIIWADIPTSTGSSVIVSGFLSQGKTFLDCAILWLFVKVFSHEDLNSNQQN